MVNRQYIFSYLIVLLPFLYFIIGNFYDLNLYQNIILIIVPTIIFTLIIFFSSLLSFFFQNKEKKRFILFASLTIFILFNFRVFNVDKINYILLLIIIPGLLTYLMKRSKNFEKVVNLTMAVMISACLFQILLLNFNYYFFNSKLDENFFYKDKIIENKPNIYSLTLDAYSRSDILIDLGFDNSYYEKYLEENGFFIAKNSKANFPSTYTSLYTFWNMQYPKIQDDLLLLDRRKNTNALLGNNITINKLKNLGYKHIRMGPNQAQKQDCSGLEDYCLFKFNDVDGQSAGTGRNIYLQIFLMTPFDYLLNYLYPGILDRNVYLKSTIGIAKESIINIDLKNFEPFFMELNVWQPHGPYILDKKCNKRKNVIRHKNSWINDNKTKKHYLDELECVNYQIIELIDYLNRNDPSAYIFITSDHGHGFYTDFSLPAKDWSKESVDSRISNFWASRLPSYCLKNIRDDITLINTFRVMFACMYNEEIKYLEDISYIHSENIDKDRKLFKIID